MNINIAVLPGDGIGPEVIEQALKVVKAVCRQFDHNLTYQYGEIGACAIENSGVPYPDKTYELCMQADAVLFGAIGSLKYDNDPSLKTRPEHGLLKMRQALGLYGNIRPVSTFESLLHKSPLRADLLQGVDFICIRELIGGIYFGRPQGRSEDGNTAFDTCVYTKEQIERIVRLAYSFALKRKKKVTMVDKANVLATSRLWREVTQHVAKEFPEVETDYMFVDNAAMQLIQNPAKFDVIVTENMFGDILTDEASVITGSMGMLPSASIGLHTSVFEPIHGSYPQAAGMNIANPLATILSAALLFEYAFGLVEEGKIIREAVEKSLEQGVVTQDLAPDTYYTTAEVGDWIASSIL